MITYLLTCLFFQNESVLDATEYNGIRLGKAYRFVFAP